LIAKLCLVGGLANALEIGPYESIEESLEHTWYPQDSRMGMDGFIDAPFNTRFIQLGQELSVGPHGLEVKNQGNVFKYQTLASRLVLSLVGENAESPRSLSTVTDIGVCGIAVSFVTYPTDSDVSIRVKAYSIEGSQLMDATVEELQLLKGENSIHGFSLSADFSDTLIAGLQISDVGKVDLWAIASITIDQSCNVQLIS
jgi:hypothetical protein